MELETKYIEAAYEFLRHLPPYCEWDLPPSHAVKFKVTGYKRRFADYNNKPVPTISGSRHNIAHVLTLLVCVAHEMVHMKQDAEGQPWLGSWHNSKFQELAEEVCLQLGFDPKAF